MSNHTLDLSVGLCLVIALILIGLTEPDDAWQRHLEMRDSVDEAVWVARP